MDDYLIIAVVAVGKRKRSDVYQKYFSCFQRPAAIIAR
uniref:Uncharacterized protein n=1 Tax=Erwinia piriflorinigrans CFBP 5888 TaxID=1161919 RepID=V5Z2L5_9GAMM|nr:hypothetical protein EPIR_pEPIR37024 [Erwinia piriflorinigrans CFBP 5888]